MSNRRRARPDVYDATTRSIHWATFAVLAVVFIAAYASANLDGDGHRTALTLHQILGLSVLLLTALRAAWRARSVHPEPVGEGRAAHLVARIVHAGFYLVLMAQPLLGWASISARGRHVAFAGITLPSLIGRDRAVAERLMGLHRATGWVLLGLVAVHVGAALVHHVVHRDRTLLRMLGGRD